VTAQSAVREGPALDIDTCTAIATRTPVAALPWP